MLSKASSLQAPPHPDPLPEGEGELRRLSRRAVFLLVCILLVAAGLRAYNLDAKSFWFDEFATAQLPLGRGYAHYDLPNDFVIESPPDFFDLANAAPIHRMWFAETGGHLPPLYVLLTRLWGEVFGLGPVSLRALSALASVAAVAMAFVVVRTLSGATAALWAAAIMALAGPQIQYAQEARNYAFLLFAALAAAAAIARIEKSGMTLLRALALTTAVLAMMLTHYFALGTIVALAIYGAVRTRGRDRRLVITCFAAAALGWLALAAPLALKQGRNLGDIRQTSFLNDQDPGHAARTAHRLALLPVRYFTEPMGNVTAPAAVGAVAFALAIVLAWRRRDLLLWALWLWLTVAPIALLDLARKTQHLEFIRYTLLASPALYALVAAALSDRPGRTRHLAPMLVTLACLLALPAAYSTWWKADWRSLARQIDAVAQPGDVTIFFRGDDYAAYPNAAYLHTSYYRRDRYGPIVLMTHPPEGQLLQRLRAAPGVTLITLSGDGISSALPGASLRRIGFEPGAGAIYRATWASEQTK